MNVPKLYYLGEPGDGFGWGVANTNLVRALGEFCRVELAPRSREAFDAPIFVPVSAGDLKPDRKWRAPRILGYCFTEWPLPLDSARNARIYDVLFAGSTWNADKLRAAGVRNVQTLIQGVDFARFTPKIPSQRAGFIVFSGGKYEFRKGQDYVLAAMKVFMRQRSDAVLLAAWHNPWPQSMLSMNKSWLIDPADPFQGLPEDRVIKLPAVPNIKTPAIYAQAHIGLFPNRCEAGTNLVMCEFMACQRPVIASYAHGHLDVFMHHASRITHPASPYLLTTGSYDPAGWFNPELRDILLSRVTHPASPYLLTTGSYDPAGWFNPEVSDILFALEHAYQHRDQLVPRAEACRRQVELFTWRACAAKIFAAAFPSPTSA